MKRKVALLKILLIGFGFFGVSVLWSLYNADIPIILRSTYGLSYAASGWVMNLDNILAVTLVPIVGFWSDHTWTRIGRRMPFIVSTMPVGAILFAIVPWIPLWMGTTASSLAAFVLTLFLVNVCVGISRSPIAALMPDVVPPEERSPANGAINVVGGCGSLLVYFVVGKVSAGNRPLGFAMASIAVLAATAVVFLTIREPRDALDRQLPRSQHMDFSLLRRLWTPSYRSLLLVCLAIFFWFMAYSAVETFYPVYMTLEGPSARSSVEWLGTRTGIETNVKFNLGVLAVAFMAFAIPAGYIGKVLSRKTAIIVGLVGVTAMVLLLAFYIVPAVELAVFVAVGFSWALVNINSLPMLLDMGDLTLIGSLTGLYYLFSQAASIVSPPLVGCIADLAGGTMSVMFPYAGIFFALAVVCMLFVRPGDKPAAPDISAECTIPRSGGRGIRMSRFS